MKIGKNIIIFAVASVAVVALFLFSNGNFKLSKKNNSPSSSDSISYTEQSEPNQEEYSQSQSDEVSREASSERNEEIAANSSRTQDISQVNPSSDNLQNSDSAPLHQLNEQNLTNHNDSNTYPNSSAYYPQNIGYPTNSNSYTPYNYSTVSYPYEVSAAPQQSEFYYPNNESSYYFNDSAPYRHRRAWNLNARVAYLYPTSSRLRHIYSSSIPFYQLETTYETCQGWGYWFDVGYFSKKGHTSLDNCSCSSCSSFDNTKIKTKLNLLQLGTGLKYSLDFTCNLSAYLGLGVTYSLINIRNDSCFVDDRVRKKTFGGSIKSGFCYYFNDCFHADLFVDYYLTKIKDHHLDLSTVATGVGVGVSF